ncbi:MAG: T9SS type A sorting domain-containing protein [Bacteroidetes bacterium]|jgi:hypothetical protein|nr:T9SS type A sorting domain-containing protein [Bacteroidota bacterium]
MSFKMTFSRMLIFSALLFTTLQTDAQFWLPVGSGVNDNVYAFAKDTVNDVLYVAGRFTNAGGNQTYRVAKWDGNTWTSLGDGFDSDVYALYYNYSNNKLIAGGNFTFSGVNPRNRIAQWDGTTWQPLGTGCNDQVLSLTGDSVGNIYAGGFFTSVDGVSAERIAKWNGTSWSALGSGIGSGSNYVEVLAFYKGNLIAGGQFSIAGGLPATGIARWDGSAWHDLVGGVSGLSSRISALKEFNGDLYCGGTFTQAGGVSANSVAKWNGTSWAALAGGITGGQAKVKSLGLLFNVLYVGGNFSVAGGNPVSNITAYDGTTWTNLSGGANNQVDALMNFNNEMYAGGAYSMMGNNTLPYISRYHTTCLISSSTSSIPVSCYNQCNGSAIVNASGFAPFTYQWNTSPVQTTSTATGLCAGVYSVIVTDSTGCSITDSVTVTQPDSLTITFTTTNPSCQGSCNGTATALNNGQGSVTYSWNTNPVQNTQTATGLCAGTYTVQITDSAGCVATDSVTIADPTANVVTISSVNPTCFNACNGQALATSTGATPFQYAWNTTPVQNTQTATGLCAGIYTVTITDSLGCTAVDSIEIINPTQATLQFTTTAASCHNICDATATVTSNGVAPFTYAWNTLPVQNTATATSLCEGNYLVTVTDSLGCSATDSVTVIQPDSLMINFTVTDLTCNSICNGSAIANVLNAQGTLSYIWNNDTALTSMSITNICAGTYTIQATDAMGCVATDSVTVHEPIANIVTLSAVNPTCFNSCDGSAVAVSTGAAPFVFSWNTIPAQNTDTAMNLCAGIYTVIATDSLGCTAVDSIEIINPAQATLQFTTTASTCFGSCNATATVTSSGQAPFTYVWNTSPIQTASVATSLCAGTYAVTVTDNNLCSVTDSVTINETPQNQLTFNTTDTRCAIACNGTTTVSSTGAAPFTYLWNDGNVTETINSLCVGNYTVTVTDNIGCSATSTVTINEAAPLPVVFTTQYSACNGNCTGAATATISGLSGLIYNWSTGSADASIDSLCPGVYSVNILDDLGCVSSDSVEIIVQPVFLNLTHSSPTCNGLCDGIATISPVGTAPFQWQWSTGDTTSLSISSLCAGTYSVNITDSAGCAGNETFILNAPPQILYNTIATDATCAGLCNGQAAITATGNGALTYQWNTNPVQTDSAATGLCFGFTSFVITDGNNCSVTDSVLIFEPFPITIGNNMLPVSCTGDCDGFLRALPSGGTPAYTYQWSTGTTFDSVVNLCAGTYTVTITDANQCTSSATYTLSNPSPISISFNVTNASCPTCNDGAVTATASGGTPPYDYLYTALSLFDSTATNLLSGYYELCVQDLHNCLHCDSVFIDISTGLNVLSSSVDDIRIYPNPFTDYAYVKISSANNFTSQLKIYDVTGREIKMPVQQISKSDNDQLYRIDNNGLKPGLYYIRVFAGNEIIGVGKFIIQ